MSRHLRRVLRKGPLVAALLVALGPLTVASSATALPANPRAFSCTGSLGEAFTQRTVAGLLTAAGRPYEVTVTQTASGLVESTRHRLAADRGPSWLHAGYTEWDVTGPNPDGNLYWLSLPPVLPAPAATSDADLDVEFAGGANGGWQIPMFDCTISGGPAWMVHPAPRGRSRARAPSARTRCGR
ncbi:MAG: hypothetical protein R2731_00340 [Nocardioides sp.]